jgi:putative transposase
LISAHDRVTAVELIKEAMDSGARLEPACKEIGISTRTFERWTEGGQVVVDQRQFVKKTPKNKLSEEERKKVLEVVNSKEFVDLPPSQIVPKLADAGIYLASESTIYRLLREAEMLAHRQNSKAPVVREIPTHIATRSNQVWTWDITWLNGPIKRQYYKLYLIVDIFSRFITGYEVWETEETQHAKTLVKKAVLSQKLRGEPLVLHSDNGSPMKAATFLATLEKLGIQSSFSRPRVSNDNPYSEALFKTLKYMPKYPNNGFSSLEEARKWVSEFVKWYNNVHLHSGIKYVTPHQKHYGQDIKILEKRKKVYELAREKHPERWAKDIRDWDPIESVALNPVTTKKIESSIDTQAM